MYSRVLYIIGAALALLFTRCAQVGILTGGKKDTEPPKLLRSIPANKSTGFTPDRIVLEFDEFVQVRDVASQVIITPLLKKQPEIVADGKKVRVAFEKASLDSNTTYRIFFGKAIADMHESNPLDGFEYIFSTGSIIDTLSLAGRVTDALTASGVSGALVAAYAGEWKDSLPYKATPLYLARTGGDGNFRMPNMPSRPHHLIAFTDLNRNMAFDPESEKVAFVVDKVVPGKDTVHLRLFQEPPSRVFIRKTTVPYYGVIHFLLNKKAQVEIAALQTAQAGMFSEFSPGREKDTVTLYYRDLKDTARVLFRAKGGASDTLTIALPRNNTSMRRLKTAALNLQEGKLGLREALRLTFPSWMDTSASNTRKMRLRSATDSTALNIRGRWLNVTAWELLSPLKEGVSYVFEADTGAFRDAYGVSNDSIRITFKKQSPADFGKLILNVALKRKQDYVVQLLRNQAVAASHRVHLSLSSNNIPSITFNELPPGEYTVRLVFDDNNNGVWDAGNLMKRVQPEEILIHPKIIKVVSDWETEEQISFTSDQKKAQDEK